MMKKLVFLLAGIILSVSAFAQFSWGFKTGLNMAYLNDSPYTTPKASMYFGALAEWRMGSVIALQPELLYSAQGGSRVYKSGNITEREKIRANYAILPVLVKFYATRFFSIEVGPQAGYILSAKRYTKVIDNTGPRAVTRHKERINSSQYNDFDFSIAAGVSYKLSRGFAVTARYSYGLTDFAKEADWRNSVIQVGFAAKM